MSYGANRDCVRRAPGSPANFDAKTLEEMNKKCPPGSEGNVNLRMVVSYWEMAAGLVNRGLIDDELFFENAGEAWFVWERLRELAPAMRAAFKNPHAWGQLEALVKRLEEWQERRAPGHTAALRQRLNPGKNCHGHEIAISSCLRSAVS